MQSGDLDPSHSRLIISSRKSIVSDHAYDQGFELMIELPEWIW